MGKPSGFGGGGSGTTTRTSGDGRTGTSGGSGGGGGGGSTREIYVTRLNDDSTAYRNLAMELIFLCRFFIQIHEGSSNSSIQLRR